MSNQTCSFTPRISRLRSSLGADLGHLLGRPLLLVHRAALAAGRGDAHHPRAVPDCAGHDPRGQVRLVVGCAHTPRIAPSLSIPLLRRSPWTARTKWYATVWPPKVSGIMSVSAGTPNRPCGPPEPEGHRRRQLLNPVPVVRRTAPGLPRTRSCRKFGVLELGHGEPEQVREVLVARPMCLVEPDVDAFGLAAVLAGGARRFVGSPPRGLPPPHAPSPIPSAA